MRRVAVQHSSANDCLHILPLLRRKRCYTRETCQGLGGNTVLRGNPAGMVCDKPWRGQPEQRFPSQEAALGRGAVLGFLIPAAIHSRQFTLLRQ